MEVAVLNERRSASTLGPGYVRRAFKQVVPDRSPRYVWTVEGPEGALVFQAGPFGLPPERAIDLPDFFPMVDGIPWMAWDLGGHHRKPSTYYYRNKTCQCLIDQEEGCYFDGGTALGASQLLAEWANHHNCSDDYLFAQLEARYPDWMHHGS